MTKPLYAQDGVDTDAGDSLSAYARGVCESTYNNSPYVRVRDASLGNFRGPRTYKIVGLPRHVEEFASPDGIGTRMIFDDEGGALNTSGNNLIAMTAMDITRWGGMPLVISNILDLKTANPQGYVRELYDGLGAAAKKIGMVLLNGETAELGAFVGSENPTARFAYNWSGVAIGVINPRRIINGKDLRRGQPVIALREDGFRSNGFSSVRKAFAMKFGSQWWQHPDAKPYIRQAAAPSVLYDNLLTRACGWKGGRSIGISYIAHITGGGIRDKFGKDMVLRRGLSAVLDDLYDLPPIMRSCAEWRGFDNEGLYSTLNCGQGALVALKREDDVPYFLELANEEGIDAKHCGEIVQTKKGKTPYLEITSRLDGKTFRYP